VRDGRGGVRPGRITGEFRGRGSAAVLAAGARARPDKGPRRHRRLAQAIRAVAGSEDVGTTGVTRGRVRLRGTTSKSPLQSGHRADDPVHGPPPDFRHLQVTQAPASGARDEREPNALSRPRGRLAGPVAFPGTLAGQAPSNRVVLSRLGSRAPLEPLRTVRAPQ
jgi:hypothetical protein